MRKLINIITLIAVIFGLGINVAMAADPAPKGTIECATYSNGGNFLYLTGRIYYGMDLDLQKAIANCPGAKDIFFHSGGGSVDAGWKMAEIVRDHGLHTKVYKENACASACTYVFMGGKTRTIWATAHMGYHNAGFGEDADLSEYTTRHGYEWGQDDAIETAMNYLAFVKAGDEWPAMQFVHKFYQNSDFANMYWANSQELVEAGFVTRVIH